MLIKLHAPAPKTTFDCPAGAFSAELVNAGPYDQETANGTRQVVRFTFKVAVPGDPNTVYMAARNFELNCSKLQGFLKKWLGSDFVATCSDSELDLKSLTGKKAEIKIDHIQNVGYKRPYCNIVGAHPPGTLTLTSGCKEEGKDI